MGELAGIFPVLDADDLHQFIAQFLVHIPCDPIILILQLPAQFQAVQFQILRIILLPDLLAHRTPQRAALCIGTLQQVTHRCADRVAQFGTVAIHAVLQLVDLFLQGVALSAQFLAAHLLVQCLNLVVQHSFFPAKSIQRTVQRAAQLIPRTLAVCKVVPQAVFKGFHP